MLAYRDKSTKVREFLDSSIFLKPEPLSIPLDVPDREFIEHDTATDTLKCSICDTTHYTVEAFVWHVEGKRHVRNRSWKVFNDLENDPNLARMGDSKLGVPAEIECRGTCWFKCSLCECQFWDVESVQQHCLGRRHKGLLAMRHQSVVTRSMHSPMIIHTAAKIQAPMKPEFTETEIPLPKLPTRSISSHCVPEDRCYSSVPAIHKEQANENGTRTVVRACLASHPPPRHMPYTQAQFCADPEEQREILNRSMTARNRQIPPPPNYDPRRMKPI